MYFTNKFTITRAKKDSLRQIAEAVSKIMKCKELKF